MKTLCLLAILALVAYAKEYRFDYEWSEQARGWLKYHVVPASWEEARMRCHAEGAVLASPLTSKLKAAIVTFVKKQTCFSNEEGVTIFSGVHATFSKGDYSSVEGVPLLRLAVTWAPGEPDNFDNSESCLAMLVTFNGSMADTNCDRVLPYVCYKKDAQLVMYECGTTDPEYIMESRTGSCYKFHKTGLVWSEAYMTCVAEGGYLAIINNDVEAKVISEIFNRNPAKDIISINPDIISVGFHDWGHYGTNFMTIHGESLEVNYHVWNGGEPSNTTRERSGEVGESCGGVWRNVHLNDNLCGSPSAFLCEKSPNSLSFNFEP